MALIAVSKKGLADTFSGYQLNYHDGGDDPLVGYIKVENGYLYIKRTNWKAGIGLIAERDMMPLPLSPKLLERLNAEPNDTLIDASGWGDTFLTEDAFDTSLVPVTDKVIQNDLQQHGLILLTEDATGARRVQVVSRDEDGRYYVSVSTPPLPAHVALDLFHEGDGELTIKWGGPNQEGYVCYDLGGDGIWRLTFVDRYIGDGHISLGSGYYGIKQWKDVELEGVCIGSMKMVTLDQLDLLALPQSDEEVAQMVDRSGWAVVHNPDPADRLHLRVKPDRKAESLGKFYNGTPVQVLSQKGEWSEVRIGLSGLQGWMMTKYLTFGETMDHVERVFPQLTYRDEYHDTRPAYDSKACKNSIQMDEGYRVVGVVEDELYILLNDLGQTGYVPQEWLFEGNG